MDKYSRLRFDNVIQDENSSSLQKYMDLVIGKRDVSRLILYELITLFFGWTPGGIGIWLRKFSYPRLFQSVGKGVVFGNHLTLRSPSRISIGADVVIDDYCVLSVRGFGDEALQIGNNVLVGRNSLLKARGGRIVIDDGTNIGHGCHVGSSSEVILGAHCLIGPGCFIGALQHEFSRTDVPIVEQGLVLKGGVRLGRGAWLGAHVIVNDGVTIGEGAVIGAGSIVTKEIPPYAIAVGSPAAIVRYRTEEDVHRADKDETDQVRENRTRENHRPK